MSTERVEVEASTQKKDIVLLMHGILSQGQWTDQLKGAIERQGLEVQMIRYPTVYLVRFWMPVVIGRWILPWFSREGPLEHVLQKILAYPQDQYRVSVVAHSFSTWLIANILQRYPAVKLHRIVFLGCVVDETFRWQDVIPRNVREGAVLNAFGTRDVWPIFANAVTWGYGPTGTFGFGQPYVNDLYNNVGHSGLLNQSFCERVIAPFLATGKLAPPAEDRKDYLHIRALDLTRYLKWALLAVFGFWLYGLAAEAYRQVVPISASQLEPKLFPECQSWDKLIEPIKPGDTTARQMEVRLGKWKAYLAKGAQPWLVNSGSSSSDDGTSPSVVLGWFEHEIADRPVSTFTYSVELASKNLEVKEIYAFLARNEDKGGISPVYKQLKPTVDKNVKEIEVDHAQAGDRLLCFILVGSTGNASVSRNPDTWGLSLRRR